MALLLVREMPGTDVTEGIASRLSQLPPERQTRVIAALADRNDPAAAPAILAALKNDQAAVRFAAVQALGRLGDASVVPALLAAVGGEGEFAEAVASSLAMLFGEHVDAAILEALRRGDGAARQVAIAALGRRAYEPATATLIACARSAEQPVRLAAIKALGETATAADVRELTELLVQAKDASDRAAAEMAVTTVHARIDEQDAYVEALAARWPGSEPAAKLALLGALRRMGGSKSLAAVRTAAGDSNAEVQDAAIRALCDWTDIEPADDLLGIARQSRNEKHQLLALRGYLRMAGQDGLPATRRLAMATEALRLAQRDEERRLALSVLAQASSTEALAAVLPFLDSETLKDEAAAAAVAIGEKLLPNDPAPAIGAMEKVLPVVKDPDLLRRATELRMKAGQIPR